MIDEAEKWLMENDKDYTDYKKRRGSEYPYHAKKQRFLRSIKEIPVSSFNGKYNRRISLGDGNYKKDTKERPLGVLSYLE